MDILIHWDKHLHALNAHFLGKLFQKRWLGDANDFIIIITTQINTFNNDSIKHSNSFQNCVNMYISKLRKHYSQVFNEKTRNVFEVDKNACGVFEVYLSSGVDVSCGITDGDGTHHFPVV